MFLGESQRSRRREEKQDKVIKEKRKMIDVNKAYNYNCIEGFQMLEDSSVSLVVTSPPYAMQRKFP